jgi:hypothetical protein
VSNTTGIKQEGVPSQVPPGTTPTTTPNPSAPLATPTTVPPAQHVNPASPSAFPPTTINNPNQSFLPLMAPQGLAAPQAHLQAVPPQPIAAPTQPYLQMQPQQPIYPLNMNSFVAGAAPVSTTLQAADPTATSAASPDQDKVAKQKHAMDFLYKVRYVCLTDYCFC